MITMDKIVLLIIFLIILLITLFILFRMGSPMGEQVNLQNELRQCCQTYRANGCPKFNYPKYGEIECEKESLWSLVQKLNMDYNQLKSFCYCKPECSDKIDNDGDGLIDAKDPQCHDDGDVSNSNSYSPYDDSEET